MVPSYGRARVGRPATTNLQQLYTETGCSMEDLPKAMDNRVSGGGGPVKSVPAARHDDDDG